MILVFASQFDESAQQAVAGWPNAQAALLSVDDLSTNGWFISNDDFSISKIVAGGRQYSVTEITGLVTLLPYIVEQELFKIEEPNRPYAAAEMTAFLYFVFTSLQCPIINKPSIYNLAGPNWRYEEWLRAGQRVSLPIKPHQRQVPVETSSPDVMLNNELRIRTIHVINDRVIASNAEEFNARVLQLATFASVQFMQITLAEDNGQFFLCSVNCIPNVNDPQVLAALYQAFNK